MIGCIMTECFCKLVATAIDRIPARSTGCKREGVLVGCVSMRVSQRVLMVCEGVQ